ncbi:hypothetical protein [Haloprofundus marisrubri]|nr:hypothetical protein [Haloprofundus marisrubri]
MPTDRDSPSADWRRVYEAMGVETAEDDGEHHLDDERIDAYADEADAKDESDEANRPESERGPTRREGHA